MNASSSPEGVVTVDCQYFGPAHMSAYLLIENGRAAFVDNNTEHAVPHLLQALEAHGLAPEQVEYAFVTHIHLDHAAGSAALLEHCPNATLVAHPRAKRHLVDPTRLVASAMSVYGEDLFHEIYGHIKPLPADRIRTVDDGETVLLGGRELVCLHTEGHARHHIAIHDPAQSAAFTGDTFGVCYGGLQCGNPPALLCTCPPTNFDPEAALVSAQRIKDSGAARVCLSHFDSLPLDDALAAQFMRSIEAMGAIRYDALSADCEGDALEAFCLERVHKAARLQTERCGLNLSKKEWAGLSIDLRLNAQGIAYAVTRARKNGAQ